LIAFAVEYDFEMKRIQMTFIFPFTAIKRSKTVVEISSILAILKLIAVGVVTVIEVLHAFSDM
jgi:hypothetical protein